MLDSAASGDDGFSLGVKIAQTAGASIYAAPPSGQFPVRDAELIAHAPADLRALCDEVVRLQADLVERDGIIRGLMDVSEGKTKPLAQIQKKLRSKIRPPASTPAESS